MNIIGDIAGQFDALLRLLKKMPDEEFLCVGDLIDRGPKSPEVVEFVKIHGKALMGNHEHLMLDYLEGSILYDNECWLRNGGITTYKAYKDYMPDGVIPYKHIEWIKALPWFYQTEDLFVSHAPLSRVVTSFSNLEGVCVEHGLGEIGHALIWHRGDPISREKFQVFGHNSHVGLKFYNQLEDVGSLSIYSKKIINPFAVCIDDSKNRRLTGIHWPSMKIFQEPF